MATLSAATHQETLTFANVWNGPEDEDYKIFLDLQMDCSGADMDPLYKVFLEHLREDGHSYILETADGDNGLPAFVKYEDDNESSEEVDMEYQRSTQHISHKRKRDCADKCSHANGVLSQESAEIGTSMDFESRQKAARSFVDESYQTFLKHVRVEDFSLILEWESKIIRYEEINGASNASEGLTSEDTIRNEEQGLVPYKSPLCVSHESEVDDGPIVTSRFNDPFQFKRQLNAILSQPFDQNEYEQLLKEASDRKPLEKLKILRHMSISYPTDKVGMSYLDHHPDLKRQLESAEPHKCLELLRGFFFWLKNLCHEGAFMPWSLVPSSSHTWQTIGYELMLPTNDAGDDTQGVLPSTPSCAEDVID